MNSTDDTRMTVRRMFASDVQWAAGVMARRRAVYEGYSPVFWRPHRDATTNHMTFLRAQVDADDSIALRTDRGFLLARPARGVLEIDDFAVDNDDSWTIDGRGLILGAWSRRPAATSAVRIVTAAADEAKASMLAGIGLEPVEQWWVKPVPDPHPAALAEPLHINTDSWSGIVASAPPVYDPGGPVLLVRRTSADAELGAIEQASRRAGAVLVVLPMPTGDDREQQARSLDWSVASSWYSGIPVGHP